MAPKKFGLFKGRSRDQQEQPSTESLLRSSSSCVDMEVMVPPPSPPSPIPSTSRGYHNDVSGVSEFAMMRIADNTDDDEDDSEKIGVPRRVALAKVEEAKMAPKKFGLFKGRSRDQQEQPSTESLLRSSSSCVDMEVMVPPPSPPSPIPSTSRGYHNDVSGVSEFAMMRIADNTDDDEDDSEKIGVPRRVALAKVEEAKNNFRAVPSTSLTSITTLQDYEDLELQSQLEQIRKFELATPDDATSMDVNSIQLDVSSIVSEDVMYCGAVAAKKPKKNKPRANQDLTDEEMWEVTNTEVMERLLKRNCTINELIKWEAIALARGICTLTTNCVCRDCNPSVPPQALTDGDAGMASAPFLSAVSIGCELQ